MTSRKEMDSRRTTVSKRAAERSARKAACALAGA